MDQRVIKHLENVVYWARSGIDDTKRPVVAFTKSHAITYRHGQVNSKYLINDTVTLINIVNANIEIKTTVVFISERNDYVVFHTINEEFPSFPINFEIIHRGQDYRTLGLDSGNLVWNGGVISSVGAGFFYGTSHCKKGDSGSAVFDLTGKVLGIIVGKISLKLSNTNIRKGIVDFSVQTPKINFTEISDHYNKSCIIPIHIVLSNLDITEDSLYEHGEKKPRIEDEGHKS
ncbi:unnamed protein product [Caenorhabditis angaria]|uniref:Peptidase S1 domain-containing protein n=1 Tax=Caenorhabditis angaria TaxID=860376 RepID=A0A9P1IIS2_9PELO|nr:unnamed protein product [Caenorhabditis angaria]